MEELIAYNELSDIVEQQQELEKTKDPNDIFFTLKSILDHEEVTPDDSRYFGSSYNVLVEWEDGTKTWEPLRTMSKDDPMTLAAYAKEHDLLDKHR